jgi:hypothetical protein
MKFFQIPDPAPFFLGEIFLHYLQNPGNVIFSESGLLLNLTSENVSSKKKVCLLLQPPPPLFTQDVGSEIRDEKILGSGIKHPRSSTLLQNLEKACMFKVSHKVGTGTIKLLRS